MKSELTQQAKSEIRIFKMFAKVAPYQINVDSIRKREAPEPDILCYLADKTPMAFELVECIDNSIAQTYYDARKLTQIFRHTLERFPKVKKAKFEEIFSNALIYAAFGRDVSLSKKRSVVSEVFDFLFTLDYNARGKFKLANSKGVIRWVLVSRGEFKGPMFDVEAATSFADPAKERIEAKFQQKYEAQVETELLAYYELQPEIPESHWLPPLREFITRNIEGSFFKRVWIYSVPRNKIVLAHPCIPYYP